jgi:hypothetical protein
MANMVEHLRAAKTNKHRLIETTSPHSNYSQY